MLNDVKIALLGGDLRQISVARELLACGFSVDLWGIDKTFCSQNDAFVKENWEEVICGCHVLVLPLPVSGDGVKVYCPLKNEASDVKLSKILDLLPRDTFVVGGRFSPAVKRMIEERGFRNEDYFLREELQIKNAIPTAEGAIALAMNELPVTISGCKAAVIGYGRIGKVLASKLRLLDADVTVAARKSTDLALAEGNGLGTLPIIIKDGNNSLEALCQGFDVVFNTVPAWVIDENVVNKMNRETLIVDLASAPGGIDLHTAKEKGLKVIWALSLPGKNSPFTAGKIIAQTIRQILLEEGWLR